MNVKSQHTICILFFLTVAILTPFGYNLAQNPAGSNAIKILPQMKRLDLRPSLKYLEDSKNQYDFQFIQSLKTVTGPVHFKPIDGLTSFGYSPSTFWLRLTIENPGRKPIHWIAEYPYAAVDHIEFFIPRQSPDGGTTYHRYRAGDMNPFSVRPVRYRATAIPITSEPGRHDIFFKIRSQGALVVALNGWGIHAFEKHQTDDLAINWFYFGIMITISLFCLLLFTSMKETIFFSLFLFVIGSALFSGIHNGLASHYFWPDHPPLSNFFHPLTGFIGVLGYLMYCRSFLQTKTRSPRFDRFLVFLITVDLFFILTRVFIPYRIATQSMIIFTGITILTTGSKSIALGFRGVRQAKIFALIWAPFIVSIFLMALKSYGFLQNSLLTDSMIQFSSSAVSILFCFGVIDKINQFRLERERALQQLHSSEKLYRLLAENVNDVIWILDLKTLKIVYITPSIEAMMGYTPKEAENFTFKEMLPPHAAQTAMAQIKQGIDQAKHNKDHSVQDYTIELECFHKNGHTFWTETTASFTKDKAANPVEMIGVTRDITSRKHAELEKLELESKLSQSGKLEALGTLAGGIAHDMNNIIGAIMGYAEISKYKADPQKRLHHNLVQIVKGCLRARDLVSQILAFSRHDHTEKQTLKIHLIIKEALKLIRASLPTTISIKTEIHDKTLLVRIDPTQLHQIIMNLCTNAGHAMKETGGVLGVSIEKIIIDDMTTKSFIDLDPGEYVRLTVSDSGHGMDDSVTKRIFEPFFTTKPVGTGTGLGLSMVHGIVKKAGGEIIVYSEPGKGTTFHIFFPSVSTQESPVQEEPEEIPVGTETILYVDDEPDLTDMVKEMLSNLGYTVITENSSQDVLDYMETHPDKVDLLIADQTMPGLTGMDLVQEIWKFKPDFPAILCSGFSDLISPEKAKELGINDYILKPFTLRDLAVRIRNILD